jgi:hypothetical protein
MDRELFLESSPREIGGMLDELADQDRRRMVPAALICSVLANIHRDPQKRLEPFSIADFIPDPNAKTEEEEWLEFSAKVKSGEKFESAPGQTEALKRMFQGRFKTIKPASGAIVVDPGPQRVLTNAIAGELPQQRRGVS